MTYRWQRIEADVETDRYGLPVRVYLRGKWHDVEHVVDRWREVGGWWLRPDAVECFRLVAGGALVVVCWSERHEAWFLSRTYD